MDEQPLPESAGLHIAATQDWPQVRLLFREYAENLGVDLCFQGFEAELAELPGRYTAPLGGVWLAWSSDSLAGCVALRPLEVADHPNACEMKRLYVRPAFRGKSVGRMLAQQVLQHATHAGYACVLLDRLGSMHAAQSLYQSLGFAQVAPYYPNPIPDAVYLKARLR